MGHIARKSPVLAALGVAIALIGTGPAQAAVSSFHESFQGGAVGSKPTSANTAYDQTIGDQGDNSGAVSVAFASGGERGNCAQFSVRPGSHVFGFLGKQVKNQSVVYFRRYYRVSTLPGYRTSILLYKYGGGGNGQLGGTHNGSFAIGGTAQAHKFTLVNNNTNTTKSKATVPTNAWFRVEVAVRFGSNGGTQTVRLFLGNNVNGTTPSETLSGPLTGSHTDYIEDGVLTNPNVDFAVKVDEAADGNTWIGPVSG
jgi:hypothetical protein